MKIGIFTGYYLPHLGGVERYVDKMASALEKRGHKIIIVTSNYNREEPMSRMRGRHVYRLPIHTFMKSRYPIPRLNKDYEHIIKSVKSEQLDFVIVNTRFHLTSLVGARLGKNQNKPVFLIEHGTDHFTVNNKILDIFGKYYEHLLTMVVKQYVDKFYGVSENCNKWLKHFNITAEGVFYNAINVADRKSVKDLYGKKYPKEELVLTYAGRLIREKGIVNLLEAFLDVKKEYPNIKLVVAGDGELMSHINKNYVDSSIEVVGRLDFNHVMSLYKRTDIFIYPSLYPEGLPTSILEAGLMECAIIATPKGGTEEVIPNKHHGIIIDGSKSSLVNAISSLVADEKSRKASASAVRIRIEKNFDWDVVAENIESEIYKYTRGEE